MKYSSDYLVDKVIIILFICVTLNSIIQTDAYSYKSCDTLGKMCNGTKELIEICKKYEVPETEEGKCFLRCAMNILGVMSATGEFDKEGSIQSMLSNWPEHSADQNRNIIINCHDKIAPISKNILGTCELAYKIMKCLNKETRKYSAYLNDFFKD